MVASLGAVIVMLLGKKVVVAGNSRNKDDDVGSRNRGLVEMVPPALLFDVGKLCF